MTLQPSSRTEHYISDIINGDDPMSPVTRVEHYLHDIAEQTVSTLPPVTRVEHYLAKISGADVSVPSPVSRIEKYLAALAGEDVETPEPVSRIEIFLQDWIDAGPSAETLTVTGVSPLTLANAISHAMLSLTQYGKCTQASAPTPSARVNIVCNNGAIKWDSVNQRIYADGTPEVLTVGEQTASVENLFKIAANNYYADYTDEQNIVSGIVTRKVGVKALDGTEDWGYSAPVHTVKIPDAVTTELRKTPLLCTHYPIIDDGRSFNDTPNDTMFFTSGKNLGIKDSNKTSEQMKAWLASQYAAGTPVIVLYPLAEETTESVTPQPLTTANGTNTVSVTAEVSDISLECEYKGVSEETP